MSERPEIRTEDTYCTLDDILTLVPNISAYLKPHFVDRVAELNNYVSQCRKMAYEWINNNLEEFELDTYALSNEKRLVEANYATYLILRGVVRGERAEQNSWVKSFRDDAKDLLENIILKATSRKGLSSRTSRFRKARWYFKDYGSDSYTPSMFKK